MLGSVSSSSLSDRSTSVSPSGGSFEGGSVGARVVTDAVHGAHEEEYPSFATTASGGDAAEGIFDSIALDL
jgi:acetyl-CoA carboxylase beta subunit